MSTPQFHIAHYNVARLKKPPEELTDFLAEVACVNVLGDQALGFVWRYEVNEGNSLAHRVQDGLIINLTVWETVGDLRVFTYRGGHLEMLRRRREWFEYVAQANVLWCVPAGHRPTVEDGEERLAYLRENGPTSYAFTFKTSLYASLYGE